MPKFLVTLSLSGYYELEVEAGSSQDALDVVNGLHGHLIATPNHIYEESVANDVRIGQCVASVLKVEYSDAFLSDDSDDD